MGSLEQVRQTLADSDEPVQSESRYTYGIPDHQVRVLIVLAESRGPLTRAKINERIGGKTEVVVRRAIGYSDPVKRAAFEQTRDGGGRPGRPCLSLLSRGYVEELTIDVAGLEETVVRITKAGREFLDYLGEISLPPLREGNSGRKRIVGEDGTVTYSQVELD